MLCYANKVLQSCPILCNPMDHTHSVHEIFQPRILEWVDISFSRRSSQSRDWNCVSWVSCIGRRVLYHQRHLRSLIIIIVTKITTKAYWTPNIARKYYWPFLEIMETYLGTSLAIQWLRLCLPMQEYEFHPWSAS